MVAFCRTCGQQVSDSANFCPNCGASVTTTQTTSAQAAYQETVGQDVASPSKKKSKALPIILMAAVLVVAAAAVFGLTRFFSSEAPPAENAGAASSSNGNVAEEVNNRVELPPIENVGDRVEFGTWRGNSIEWRVLAMENGRALVVSEDILTVRQYDDFGVSSYDQIDWNTAAATWAESDIRAWLNGEFLDTAFTTGEQGVVNLSHISNPDNPDYGTEGGADTEDRVFLLSIDEVNRYFSGDSDRIANITMTEEDIQYRLRISEDYWGYDQASLGNQESTLRSDYLGQSKAYSWWLRSPGDYSNRAAGVPGDGEVYAAGIDVYGDDGVRPALWLNLQGSQK
jgi:hypothetical protein